MSIRSLLALAVTIYKVTSCVRHNRLTGGVACFRLFLRRFMRQFQAEDAADGGVDAFHGEVAGV